MLRRRVDVPTTCMKLRSDAVGSPSPIDGASNAPCERPPRWRIRSSGSPARSNRSSERSGRSEPWGPTSSTVCALQARHSRLDQRRLDCQAVRLVRSTISRRADQPSRGPESRIRLSSASRLRISCIGSQRRVRESCCRRPGPDTRARDAPRHGDDERRSGSRKAPIGRRLHELRCRGSGAARVPRRRARARDGLFRLQAEARSNALDALPDRENAARSPRLIRARRV